MERRSSIAQVQQQAALMASVGQGGYLSPMAAFAAAQMQHMATINGLPGAPLTPTSGRLDFIIPWHSQGKFCCGSSLMRRFKSTRVKWELLFSLTCCFLSFVFFSLLCVLVSGFRVFGPL